MFAPISMSPSVAHPNTQPIHLFDQTRRFGHMVLQALGALLGAPRNLQALARDRVVPHSLGRGYGTDVTDAPPRLTKGSPSTPSADPGRWRARLCRAGFQRAASVVIFSFPTVSFL